MTDDAGAANAEATEPIDTSTEAGLAALLVKLTRDKRTRRSVVKAIKELDPSRTFADQEIQDFREEVTAAREQEKVERESERVRTRLEASRAALRDRYDEETIAKIENDVMIKHGIADYDLAAKIFAADQPPPTERRQPEHRHGSRWELQADMDEYFKDPTKAALNNAYAAIDQSRSAQR